MRKLIFTIILLVLFSLGICSGRLESSTETLRVENEQLIVESRDGCLSLIKDKAGNIWAVEPDPAKVDDGQMIGFGVNEIRKKIFLYFIKEQYQKEGNARKGKYYRVKGQGKVIKNEKGGSITYEGMEGDYYRISLQVKDDNDIEIGIDVKYRRKEMLYATFGVKGIPDSYEVIIPADSGLSFNQKSPYFQRVFDLEIPLVIIQGKDGGIAFWADDTRLYGTNLFLKHSPGRFDLAFLSEEADPNRIKEEFQATRWQLRRYNGNWTTMAKFYRELLISRYSPELLCDRKSWVKDIKVLIDMGPHQSIIKPGPRKTVVDRLAELFDPASLVLLCYQSPDLEPAPMGLTDSFAVNAAYARDRGSHILVYNSYRILNMPEGKKAGHFLCPEKFPDCFCLKRFEGSEKMYQFFLPYIYDRYGAHQSLGIGDPMGTRLGLVRLSFKPWRDIIISILEEAAEKYHIDGCFFDTAAVVDWDNPTPPVDKFTEADGTIAFWKELAEELPEMAFMSEGISESILAGRVFIHMIFPQWADYPRGKEQRYLHPISAYIWSPFVWKYAYNSGFSYFPLDTTPDTADAEIIGHIPMLPGDLEWLNHPSMEFLICWAQLHSQRKLKRIYPDDWLPSVCSYYVDKDGIPIHFERVADGDRMVEIKDGQMKALFGRFHNCTEAKIKPEQSLLRWPAYDSEGAIGLNPQNWYPWLWQTRYDRLRISQIPPDSIISSVREGDGYLAIELSSLSGELEKGTLEFSAPEKPKLVIFSNHEPVIPSSNKTTLEINNSNLVIFVWELPSLDFVSEDPNKIFTLHAMGPDGFDRYLTYPNGGSIQKNKSSAGKDEIRVTTRPTRNPILVDAAVRLPAGAPVLYCTPTVLDDYNPGTSVEFELQVNGQALFHESLKKENSGKELSFDLSKWQGQNIFLTFITRRQDGEWTQGWWDSLRVEGKGPENN